MESVLMTTAVSAARSPLVVGTDVCRLTIAGPAGRADLAVPVTTTVSTLLPMLLRHVPADPGQSAGTWVLQRLGEEPLPLEATPKSAGLRHGDVLYLRPADDPLPGLEFDDVSDGVAFAIGARRDRWRPEWTRRLFLALACLVLAAFAAAVAGIGRGPTAPLCYGIAALALGIACAADSRQPADRATLLITGTGACVFGALAGLTAAHGTAAVLFGAAGAGVVAALLLPTRRLPLEIPATVLAAVVLTEFVGALVLRLGWDAVRAGSTVAVICFLVGHSAPRTALRLARLRVPDLPHNAAELQEALDPEPEEVVVRRVAVADALLTAATASSALVTSAVFVLITAHHRNWAGTLLVLLFAMAVLLRSKNLNTVWQRLPLVFCGALGLVALLLSWAQHAQTGGRITILLTVLVGVGLLLVGAWRLPTARLLPVWGVTAEILEMVMALSLLPLLLQMLHTYYYFRVLVS
jgi:type VII secretion integral membrane protein EccD